MVSGPEFALVLSVFLACAVEAVEALTIVLAMGSTRGWRSSLYGCAAAAVTLAAIVAAFGPALTQLPVDALRVFVGGLLLIFGLQWLRKAILRAAGLKALRDEKAAFARTSAAARAAEDYAVVGVDAYGFVVSFKGVLLEGLEVAAIVLTFGANQHRVPLAAATALVAIALVALAGLAVRRPLAQVPENTMKLVVGVMLTSFGMFWGAQGAGAVWPGDDAALLAIIPGIALASLVSTLRLRRLARRATPASDPAAVSAEVN